MRPGVLVIAGLCFAAAPAPPGGKVLLLADDAFFEVSAQGDFFSADAGTVAEARFWKVTRQDLPKSDGSYEGKSSASLASFKVEQLRSPPRRVDAGTGDCGIEESWLAGATVVSSLAKRTTPQTYAVQVPPGWERKELPKRLLALVKAELGEVYSLELGGDSLAKKNAGLSAAFSDGAHVLWYVSSENELRGYVTIFFSKTPEAPPVKVARFDFVGSCP